MDYKKVLRLHFVNHLSCREIAESCGDCSKTTVNEFLKRFRENPELSYPLPADVTNEYIGNKSIIIIFFLFINPPQLSRLSSCPSVPVAIRIPTNIRKQPLTVLMIR